MTSLPSIVPSTWGAQGLDWFSLSGAMSVNGAAFANILAGLSPTSDASQGTQSSVLSQLSALIQNGTPLSKIVDQLSQSVGNALAQQLQGLVPQSDIDQLRSSLTQSIANALAPPGNGPPGTPQQQAAALANRLRQVVETLARDAQTDSGQLNDIAGSILDAKSAKDTPAQTLGTRTASTLDVSSLVSSLLSNALAALQHAPVGGGSGSTRTLKGDPLQRDPRTLVPLGNAVGQSSLPSQAPALNDTPSTPNQTGSNPVANAIAQQTPAITVQNAPDLLARMLVRAAGTDARINGVSALASGNAPSSATPNSGLAARLDALLATVATNAATTASSQNGAFSGSGSGNSFDQQLAQQAQPSGPAHDTSSPVASVAVSGPSLSSQVQSLAQNAQATPQRVDTSAVIEQMVKSMMVRTNAQGSSEIRLHLQPENLGDMTMKITVSGSQISANVIASSAEVRNALISSHHQLAKSLADAGLQLSGFSVDVSGGNAGRDRQNNDRTAGFGRRYTVHELQGATTADTPALASLGPPLLSGSSLALFNYLA